MSRHLLLTFAVLFAVAAPLRAQEGVIWGWNVTQGERWPIECATSNFALSGGNTVWAFSQTAKAISPNLYFVPNYPSYTRRNPGPPGTGSLDAPGFYAGGTGDPSGTYPGVTNPLPPVTVTPVTDPGPVSGIPGSPGPADTANVETFETLHSAATDELNRLADGLDVNDLVKSLLKGAITNLEKEKPEQLLIDLKTIRETLAGQELVMESDLEELDKIISKLEQLFGSGASHITRTLYRAQCDPCAPVGCGDSWTRNLRFQGFGNYMDQKAVGNPFGGTLDGYTAETYGFLLALDRKVGRNGVVGAAFNGSFGKLESNDGVTRSDNDMYLVSLYGGLRHDAWTLGGSVGYAYVDYDLRQPEDFMGFEAFRTAYHGNLVTAAGELSRDFRLSKRSTLSPFISLNYIHLWETGFKTSGMAIDAKETESYLQTLGIRWQWSRRYGNGRALQLSATAGWIHDYGDGMLYGGASYDFPGSDQYIVPGASRNKDRALLDVGLNMRMNRRWSAHVSYGAEFADDFTMHGFRVGAVRTW